MACRSPPLRTPSPTTWEITLFRASASGTERALEGDTAPGPGENAGSPASWTPARLGSPTDCREAYLTASSSAWDISLRSPTDLWTAATWSAVIGPALLPHYWRT